MLDYLQTKSNATIGFYASDMILDIDSNAACLVMARAKCRVAGYYHLSNTLPSGKPPSPFLNGTIHVKCKALQHVVTFAIEAETAVLFYNTKTVIEIRHSIQALGH